jgi:hypothetical protein
MLIVDGSFGGAWFAFIGWFLLQAATAEARYVATEQALSGLQVRVLMAPNPARSLRAAVAVRQPLDLSLESRGA